MREKSSDLAWHSPQFYPQARSLAAQRVRFIDHQGTRILIIDFSGAELDLVKAVAAECLHIMSAQPLHSVLSLVEVEGIPFHTEALRIGAELTDKCGSYAARSAVSGVTGFRSFLLQTIADAAKQPIRLFKDRASALEWLVSAQSQSVTGKP